MNNIQRFRVQLFFFALIIFVVAAIVSIAALSFVDSVEALKNDAFLRWASWGGIAFSILLIATWTVIRTATKPLETISNVISYAGHTRGNTPPKTDNMLVGKELSKSLSANVYDLGTITRDIAEPQNSTQTGASSSKLFHNSPLPMIALNREHCISALNLAAENYFSINNESLKKPIFDVLNIQFTSEQTLEQWMHNAVASTASTTRSWERVRRVSPEGKTMQQFELHASYYANTDANEPKFFISCTDRSAQYDQFDSEVSYLAMAVPELRTPLTVMKGYIEVLEDEAAPSLNEEMQDFITKTRANADQLSAFIGNILNIARVYESGLTLKLQKHDWALLMREVMGDLAVRAKAYGITIDMQVQDGIPEVAVDRISINQVMNNLIDNAIKYSGESKKIVVTSTLNQDGLVETTVQDFGVGIAQSVTGDLFQKFFRSHRTKKSASGTGIGLYLCKALITAHGGNIWVRSKEGEGSSFSFTVHPYTSLENGELPKESSARGWIKNHSLNRQ